MELNGSEFIGRNSAPAVAKLELAHHRIAPRPPDHNAVLERFHGTILQECYRPAFHRSRFDRLSGLETAWETLGPLQPPQAEPQAPHAGTDPAAGAGGMNR